MEQQEAKRLSIGMRSKADVTALALEGEVSIYTARELHRALLDGVRGNTPIRIDMAGVHRIDTAGYQLLVAARREFERRDLAFTIENPSQEAGRIMSLYGSVL